MPGIVSDPGDFIVPFEPDPPNPTIYPIRIGIRPPILRIRVNWSCGNLLHVACLRPTADSDGPVPSDGGKVVEVKLGGSDDGSVDGERRIAYGSVPAFALLQSRKNSLLAMERMSAASFRNEWWQHVLEYSNQISDLLGPPKFSSDSVIEDPRMVLPPIENPTSLKAAWQLLTLFYVDKLSSAWLPERLVDWLAEYDSLLSKTETTIHSKLLGLQKKLVNLQVVEDDTEYWEGISMALAVGWLDVVVKLLRLHGSYQLDQIGNRETENGLVEAVAVLVSTMPRMRPDLTMGKLGQCYKNKSDFIKAWEKWRGHITKLDCSAFWVQCGHHQTQEGLKNLLQIMLGNVKNITSATCHWMELCISHLLYMRPFTLSLEGLHSLAQKCMQLKPKNNSNGLMGILLGILGENIEVVLAECSKTFGPWLVTHATELLTVENDQADVLLHEERDNLGGISIDELHRLVYAQVLSSHPLTWQIAPTYLASCPKQGLGLLENLLYKQPVQHCQMILKNLEICRLYELDNISSSVMKIAGMYHWKHDKKGSGVYWLQQARDEVRLGRIAKQLFDSIGKSVSDDSFKQWEGLIELLGSEVGSTGGLEFLHKYRDFKRSLQQVQNGRASDAARQAVESLIQLMKAPSTPQRFWLSLLNDSVPSYISRSVAGSYDNEAVAIFALIFTFYLYTKTLNTGSLFYATLNALAYFYMVCSWGGYTFIINLIPMHVLLCVVTGRYSSRLYIAYAPLVVLGTLLAALVPVVGFNAVMTSEHFASFLVFIIIHVVALVYYVKAILVALVASSPTKGWSGRSSSLLDPTYASKYVPIIASVSEHQPPTWPSYFMDINVLAFLVPAGIVACFLPLSDASSFVILYIVTSVYFPGVMVRLMLVLAPAACIMSGIALSEAFSVFTLSIKLQLPKLLESPVSGAGDANAESSIAQNDVTKVDKHATADKSADVSRDRPSKKNRKKEKEKEKETVEKTSLKSRNEKRLLVLPLEASAVAILLLIVLGGFYVVHCVWAAAEAYSAPSIVLTSHSDDGLHVFDDFREAYAWLSHNTDVDDKAASWWDYGYQTTAMANRAVIVDNNTWNNTHIATVGTAMSSPERAAWEIFNSLDVKYVLVVFGGLVGYPSDDISKFLWMVRIGGGVFPHIKEPDYLRDGQYRIDSQATPTMLNCLMYKLSYYRFVETDGKGFDRVRRTEIGKKYFKLTHFEEVFTTHHWMVRIYKLKPQKNRIRGKLKKSKSNSKTPTSSSQKRDGGIRKKSMALKLVVWHEDRYLLLDLLGH